jgi:predicted SnoaL-like aldol condensation-catalyzing enzyme
MKTNCLTALLTTTIACTLSLACAGATPAPDALRSDAPKSGAPSAQTLNATAAAKALVLQATGDLFVQKKLTAIDQYWAEPYLQHNPQLASGVEPFRALVTTVVPAPGFTYQRSRAIADGDLVVTHGRYTGFGPRPVVAFDMFRVRDGKIVEHWDALQPEAVANPSGHTMQDGSTAPEAFASDVVLTDTTRTLVAGFVDTILVRGDAAKIGTFIGASYTQHNPQIADDLAGLGAFLGSLKEKGVSFRYTKMHKIVAEGNFALTQSEGEIGGQKKAFYDLFRVHKGAIVEHWDVIADVPAVTKSGLPVF